MTSAFQLLDNLTEEMKRTAEDASVDAVHDLRVSVRRATEAIRIFAPGAKRLRRDIKAVRERAGAVRDRDVTRQLLRRRKLPAADPALIYLQGQRDFAAEQLRAYLKEELKKDHPSRWRRWLEDEK